MITRVSESRAALPLLLLLVVCVLDCRGEPSPSRVHFSSSRRPASLRVSAQRPWARNFSPRPAPADRERFKSRSACDQPPRDPGRPCGEELVRYTYAAASNSCVPFLYGGCRGNANNFATFQQCRDQCKTAPTEPAIVKVFGVSKTVRTSGAGRWDRRGSRQGPGARRQSGDSKIHFRQRFGGRRRVSAGVGPRFGGRRETDPELAAGIGPRRGIFFPGPVAQRPQPAPRPARTKSRSACLRAPRQSGWPCGESIIRYSYLRASNSCVPFEYGGCGGSTNSFGTFSECSELCKTAPVELGPRRSGGPARRCRLPWNAGRCRGYGPMMRYFYNQQRGVCELALYSGCGGNPNRFFSRYSCERTCLVG